ncbi:MAG TPA: sulfatase-like hydrolase/transferase [Solirubrobacteraceae bacterium]|nr:sulfatase-like hydrolase/transferase [Solirubrobacteraceae bacterium]
MKVATVIVSRNRPDLVESTIEQLRRYDSVPNDIYVVECGTDADKLTPHTSVWYADPDFRGKCYGHDLGLKFARGQGDYDAFFMLMNDLVFDRAIDHVGELVRLLEENPRLAIVSPTDTSGQYPGSAARSGNGWRPVTTADYLALMTRAEAIDEVGFLNPDFRYCWGAIHELSFKLYSRGWALGYADGVTYEHLGGTTYGAAGTATIKRDEYVERAKSFAHHYFLDQYGPDWSDVFWQAAAGHGIEINTYAAHRKLWAPARPEPPAPEAGTKLHLGSGTEYRPGWVNVDIDPACNPDVVSSVDRLDDFADGTAAVIEACHLFEHLTFDEAHAALAEWHRVLRPGGELYLEMPDFEQCVRLLGQHFDAHGHDLAMVGIYGWAPDIAEWGHTQVHKWGWTKSTLSEALRAAGFDDIEFLPVTQTARPAAAIGRDMRCRARRAQATSADADYTGVTAGFPQVREIKLLAFAEEILENDALLHGYRATFSSEDPVALVIYCPSETPELAAIVHERALAAGFADGGPNVALIAVPNDPDTHAQLTDSADILYSRRDAKPPFTSLVQMDDQQPAQLRALVGSLLSGQSTTQVPAHPAAAASPPSLPSSPSFLLLTLDSCRYDVMCDARTPVLDRYVGEFLPAQTPANFTYAAHHAFFAGILPHVPEPRAYYNRFVRQLFALTKAGEGHRVTDRALKAVHSGSNLVSGLRDSGYQTVGAGAMNWFQQDALTRWFEKFTFTDTNADAQIDFLLEELDVSSPFFGFINFGETHDPFYYKGKETQIPFPVQARLMEWPPREEGKIGRNSEPYWHQVEALEFLDGRLGRLFEAIPDETIVIVCGDHGEAFGEDGYWGHAVNHPKVHEVPLAIVRLDGAPLP